MQIIGITGPTGCGKSTLLEELKKRGAVCIDCDRLYDEMVTENEALRSSLRAAFGNIFLPDGSLDRKRLAKVVFSDKEELEKLNTIVFRHVRFRVQEILLQKQKQGATLAAVEAINLMESGLDEFCATTVSVVSDRKNRMTRIMQRDSLSRAAAKQRIDAQKSDDYYRVCCQHTLFNDGTEEEFYKQTQRLLDQIIA